MAIASNIVFNLEKCEKMVFFKDLLEDDMLLLRLVVVILKSSVLSS